MSSFRFAAFALSASVGAVAMAAAQVPPASDPAGAGSPAATTSQGLALAPVIVTAQKYSQNVQDVPIAITALSGSQLANRGVVDVEGLSLTSPGVLVSDVGGSAYDTLIGIRGVTQLDYGLQQESPIALYVDGAYMSFVSATGFGFYDLKDIQILRGPQGTLFGRNATGGAILLTANQPTDYFAGYLQVGQGSYNEHRIEGAISGPIGGGLDARLSFLYNRQDGYVNNTLGPSFGSDNTVNARLQFQYTLNGDTKDLLEISGLRTFPIAAGVYFPFSTAPNPANNGLVEENTGALFVQNCASLGYTVAPGATNCLGEHLNYPAWSISTPYVGFMEHTFASITNTLTHKMSWATLTSITNYSHLNQDYAEDDSDGPEAIFAFKATVKAYQASQELRLSGETKRAHWVAGLYYLTIPGDYTFPVLFPPYTTSIQDPYLVAGPVLHQNTSTYAAYGQTTYTLAPRWSAVVGGRIEKDRKRLDLINYCLVNGQPNPAVCAGYLTVPDTEFISGTIAGVQWSGNFQLQYKPHDGLMLYAGIRRGTRDGELTISDYPFPNQTFNDLVIQPEILTDTEAGFKSTLLGERVRLDGDVFNYHYHDYQAFKTVGISPVLFNAQARDYGAELSADTLLTPTVTARLDLAYLHTRVMGVTLPDGSECNNGQQPLSPHMTVTAELRKEWHESFGSLFGEFDATYVGSRYLSTVNAPEYFAPSYWTGNATFGYTTPGGAWTATVSVDNVNDKLYKTEIFDNTSTAGYGMYNVAAPRWVRGEIRYNF